MMPTFPSPPLKFRTAGFPRYGFKASMSDRAFLPLLGYDRNRGSFLPKEYETCAIFLARPPAYCARVADMKAADRCDHRPASTQETGITVWCRMAVRLPDRKPGKRARCVIMYAHEDKWGNCGLGKTSSPTSARIDRRTCARPHRPARRRGDSSALRRTRRKTNRR